MKLASAQRLPEEGAGLAVLARGEQRLLSAAADLASESTRSADATLEVWGGNNANV